MRIGIDLGGTKIEALALDDDGVERFRQRVPTPANDYRAAVTAIRDLVLQAEAETGTSNASVGVGIPGTISPATGLVKNANSQALIGHPLDRDLSTALERPVIVANDANCFALSEATDGAAAGERPANRPRVVVGVIIGTGTGAGVVVDGQVLVGPDGISGEWGHNPLPWPTGDEYPQPDCWCGLQGCMELYVSGPGLQRDHEARTGEALKAPAIVAAASNGDAAASESLTRYTSRLTRGLATLVNAYNPDIIVLGGGMSNVGSLYEVIPDVWGKYVFSDVVSTRLVQAQHGDSSGVRGAAWLWNAS